LKRERDPETTRPAAPPEGDAPALGTVGSAGMAAGEVTRNRSGWLPDEQVPSGAREI